MDHIFTAACLAAPVIVYGVYHWYTHISLANIPGSKSASFILDREFERTLSRTGRRLTSSGKISMGISFALKARLARTN
ncbi:hypothetical protein M405DRAFT_351390 [Rhizopogon salebrosus TDB-379]|nr:hypothetical protein M405DRAFT_351390 [Rhizopogon salebrosus TDB-379]